MLTLSDQLTRCSFTLKCVPPDFLCCWIKKSQIESWDCRRFTLLQPHRAASMNINANVSVCLQEDVSWASRLKARVWSTGTSASRTKTRRSSAGTFCWTTTPSSLKINASSLLLLLLLLLCVFLSFSVVLPRFEYCLPVNTGRRMLSSFFAFTVWLVNPEVQCAKSYTSNSFSGDQHGCRPSWGSFVIRSDHKTPHGSHFHIINPIM